ncbi:MULTISPECIES: nucleotidyltransferase family protein [unclassified Bradyrhizobium]|uniref:nucleotidyltransferase family protein n=1 Tax=unclassified Bradyrhizobium TaxID=2631580 RepID=UPI0028E5CF50|nr:MULTISPECIES: nucleotidyltransferase family protein [unclassified Bradyrhizobium]
MLDYGLAGGSGRSLKALLDAAPERLVPFLTQHKLLPIVMRAAGGEISAAVAETAAGVLRQHDHNSRALLAEAQALAELLSDRHIRFALLKGHGLSVMAYGDAHVRSIGDIDMIVHPKDLDVVHELIMSRGYTQELLYAGETLVSRERPPCPVAKLTDRLLGNYHRIDGEIDYCIEIHYRVDGLVDEATDVFLDHAAERPEIPGKIKLPSDELQFLFFCVDKKKDFIGGLLVSPRDILDLLMIIGRVRQPTFWDRVAALQRQLGASAAVRSVLGLLMRLADKSADPAHPVWRLVTSQDVEALPDIGWPLIFETQAGPVWTAFQRAETQRVCDPTLKIVEEPWQPMFAETPVSAHVALRASEDGVRFCLHIDAANHVLCARGSLTVRLFECRFSAPPPGRGCEIVWHAESIFMRTFGLDPLSPPEPPVSVSCRQGRTPEGDLDIEIFVPTRLLDAIVGPGEVWAADLVLCAAAYSAPDGSGRFTKKQVAVLPRRRVPQTPDIVTSSAVGDGVVR